MIDVTQASLVLAGLSALVGILVLGGSLVFFGVFVHREYPPEVPEKKEEALSIDPALLSKRSAAYRLGGMVLIGLAVLTGVEYAIGLFLPSMVLLFLMGLFKAGLILQFFMHLSTLWSEEEHS